MHREQPYRTAVIDNDDLKTKAPHTPDDHLAEIIRDEIEQAARNRRQRADRDDYEGLNPRRPSD